MREAADYRHRRWFRKARGGVGLGEGGLLWGLGGIILVEIADIRQDTGIVQMGLRIGALDFK